jgi:proteic killer suppression protein
MNITFSSRKMSKLCNSGKEMRAQLGTLDREILEQRLLELVSVTTLEEMATFFPAAGCHELSQNRKGQLAVKLKHPKRLVFVPDHEPIPHKPDGGLDWKNITQITIIEIVDYH